MGPFSTTSFFTAVTVTSDREWEPGISCIAARLLRLVKEIEHDNSYAEAP